MTVSVNHAQQMTITTSLSSASTTSLSSSSSASISVHQSFQQHHNHTGALTTQTNPSTNRDVSLDRPSSPNSSGSDTDPIATSSSTTALRRLYFKSGRNAKTKNSNAAVITSTPLNSLPQTNVSKVALKGSTANVPPETTINTSTESASTMLTNITATDTETCDSLDLAELSGQNEPLLLSSLDESSNSEILNSVQSNSNVGISEESNSFVEIDPPILINYDDNGKISSERKSPNTAPIASSTYFIFDLPSSPKSVQIYGKNKAKFTFEDASNCLHSQFNDKLLNLEYQYHHNDRDIELKENKKRKDDRFRYIEKDNYLHKNNIVFDRHGGERSDTSEDKKPKRSPSNRPGSKNCNKTSNIDDYNSNKEKYDTNNSVSSSTEDKYYYKQKNMKNNEFRNSTLFPFDREAIDYELIQRECFTVEDDTRLKFDYDPDLVTYDPESPTLDHPEEFDSPSKGSNAENYDSKNDIFYQYKLLAQQEQNYNQRGPIKRNRSPDMQNKPVHRISKIDAAFSPKPTEKQLQYQNIHTSLQQSVSKFDQIVSKFDQIPPKFYDQSFYQETELPTNNTSSTVPNATQLPNLRIDFFSEPIMTSTTNSNTTSVTNKLCATSSSSAVDNQLDSSQKITHSVGSINVTPNPMDTAVCTQPRATIVVQQASLSLDNTVETYLLKNDGDFISVEQGKGSKKKKQREENMQQLLDVTNTFTSEELRDFENRYGSPHHSRSQSVKTPGSRSSGRPNQLTLPSQRSRVASMPNTGVEEEYYRLRHFSITGKGIVNRGDSLKSRRSRSNNSVASSNSSNEHLTAIPCVSAKTSATCSLASSRESSTSNPGNGPYRVLMLGGAAVGKSSLVSQFMTSEYLHAYDTSIDDESGEKAVSVLLSGEESELVFIDHSFTEMSPENCLSSYEPHGYCVIYSSSDRSSFVIAERVLQVLWQSENIAQKAVILVANKADLARSRAVSSEEGKGMAIAYDCKFIETSVGINHNVDELLVGLLSQIRLKLENPEKSRDLFRKRSSRKSKRRACSPLGGAATACLTGAGTNPSTPVTAPPAAITTNIGSTEFNTPPGSLHSSPRKYRGSRTSASLKVKGLLGRVWARDSKSKSCENLHVL